MLQGVMFALDIKKYAWRLTLLEMPTWPRGMQGFRRETIEISSVSQGPPKVQKNMAESRLPT